MKGNLSQLIRMNKNLFTIIYYTSNREDERFEKKIRDYLSFMAEANNIPIISVSQKPIDLGKNICVGLKQPNDQNLYRQIQIGCKEAKTPFVISAESDFLYPLEYFKFTPKDTECFYRYANIWICYKKFDYFFKKKSSEGAMIAGREFYIKQIDKILEGGPEWNDVYKDKIRNFKPLMDWKTFGENGDPAISFKTNKGLRQFTRTISGESDINELPYWGNIKDLKREFNL